MSNDKGKIPVTVNTSRFSERGRASPVWFPPPSYQILFHHHKTRSGGQFTALFSFLSQSISVQKAPISIYLHPTKIIELFGMRRPNSVWTGAVCWRQCVHMKNHNFWEIENSGKRIWVSDYNYLERITFKRCTWTDNGAILYLSGTPKQIYELITYIDLIDFFNFS